MAKIIGDSHYDIGGYREVYEDRVIVKHMTTAGGLSLLVAAVADGVGGENKGERAAQSAIDALLIYLEKSRETDHAALLTQAVEYANKAVWQLQRESRGMSTTLSVALVDLSHQKLFIANVGDSRVYFCRNRKLTQLTIDHTFATEMAWRGVISADAAKSHPRANVLMRALGAKEDVTVDLGFYVGTSDYDEANARGVEGLPLQDGDAILVCSDGLVKDSAKTHQPLITTDEITRTLHDKEGKKAAQELVSFALGRGPDDNISAAVIQMPDRWRGVRARRPLIYAANTILVLMIILGYVWYRYRGTTQELSEIAMIGTATAQWITEVAGYTATPTNTATATLTPTPTLPPPVQDQVAIILPDATPLLKRNWYQAPAEGGELKIYHRTDMVFAYLLALPGARLSITFAEPRGSRQEPEFELRIKPDSQVFLETGEYRQGYAVMEDADIDFALDGCLALQYSRSPGQVLASCYEGSCGYNLIGVGAGEITSGQQVLFTVEELAAGAPQPIPESEARLWGSRLPEGSTAFNCANRYIPTPTPTHTPRPLPTRTYTPRPPRHTPGQGIQPTDTPRPTATNTPRAPATVTQKSSPTPTLKSTSSSTPKPTPTHTPRSTSTDTPRPTATDTPRPTATDTPKPTATDTPKPPTDTPKPTSTDTPEPPPTETPKPPTDTDTPPPTDTDRVKPTKPGD